MNPQMDCLFFNGYKPCGRSTRCDSACPSYRKRGSQVLLIHLGALGAVVRSTSLLAGIRRRYPDSQLTWVTQSPADQILRGHTGIDRLLTLSSVDLLKLSVLEFDVALVVDKSLEATGVLRATKAREVYGFVADSVGVIHPATEAARRLYEIGLSDEEKFHINTRTEQDLLRQALELDSFNDDYDLPLTASERDLVFERRCAWSRLGEKIIVGLNTGCAATIPAKKLSISQQRELIRKISKNPDYQIVLLGGPEDSTRNQEIAQGFNQVIQSPTQMGLRDGLVSVAACDVVITGDSLGLHMAISQKRQVIAWFGPTCAHEVDLYDRGDKVLSEAPCGPCWKRTCHKPVMCYDLVSLDDILQKLEKAAAQSRHSDRLSGGPAARSPSVDLG
jgi:heptosyltransferase-2